jgi:hypothetical protein
MSKSFYEDGELPDDIAAQMETEEKPKRLTPLWRRSYRVPLAAILIVLGFMGWLSFNLLKLSPAPVAPVLDSNIRYITVTATPGQYTRPNTFTTWIDYRGSPTPADATPAALEKAFAAAVPACNSVPETDTGKFVFRHTLQQGMELYRADADGKNLCRLTHNETIDDYPSWSPDGTQIAFVSESEGYGIYVMDTSGQNRRKIFDKGTAFSFPDWSPDGQSLVFQATINDVFDIYRVNLDGTQLTNLTADLRLDTMPDWSPDSRSIVFASDRTFIPDGINRLHQGNSYDIYIMNADDGRNVLRLTDMDRSDILPAWSPDGERIAFETPQSGFIIQKDGSNIKSVSACNSPVWMSEDTLGCLNQGIYRVHIETEERTLLLKSPDYGDFHNLDYTPEQP